MYDASMIVIGADASRSLQISATLEAVLFAAGGAGPRVLRWRRIVAAERGLGCRLPDDLIVAWAVVGEDEHGGSHREEFSPEGAMTATNAMFEHRGIGIELPTGLIALQSTGTRGEYECISHLGTGPADETRIAELQSDCQPLRYRHEKPLSDWVWDRYVSTDEPRPTTTGLVVTLEAEPAIRVHHGTFGDGEIIDELVDDVVVVRFGDGAQRRLKRRFLVVR